MQQINWILSTPFWKSCVIWNRMLQLQRRKIIIHVFLNNSDIIFNSRKDFLKIMNETEIKQGLKDFIVENLGVDADALQFETPLFEGTEIGLDSIDSIEIISYIDDTYQVSMTGVAKEHFRSIDTITAYIVAHK